MKAAVVGFAFACGCAGAAHAESEPKAPPSAYDAVIAKHARANGVPERLIRRIIVRESRYNPAARNGRYFGMMQILPATAKSMGYQGEASGLLDADTNLTYGVRYLAGAYKVAGGDENRAMGLYASGYYYDAKRKGMLAAIGLGRGGRFTAPSATPSPAPTGFELASVTTTAAAPTLIRIVLPAAPTQTAAAIPLPPVRDPQPVAVAAVAPAPRGFVFGRAAPAPIPAPAAPVVVAAATPSIPLPPMRDPIAAQAVVAKDVGRATPVVRTAAPAPQLASAGPVASRTFAPVLAANAPAVPTPPLRVAPAKPTQPLALAAATPPKPRVIAPTAAPVFASAGPLPPVKPRAPSTPTAAPAAAPATLAFAGPAAESVRQPAIRDATGSLGFRR